MATDSLNPSVRAGPIRGLALNRDPVRSGRLLGGLLILVVVALGAWMLKQTYDSDMEDAAQSLGNQAVVFGENVKQLINSADTFLSTAARQLKFDAQGNVTNRGEMHALLSDWSQRLPLVASFVVATAAGQRVIDTRLALSVPSSDVSATNSYAWARDEHVGIIGIVGPSRTAVGTGPYVLSLVQRIESDDGRFLGLIAQVFDVETLVKYFSQINLGKDSAITLFRKKPDSSLWTILTRYPADQKLLGRDVARNAPRLLWLLKTPEFEAGKSTGNPDGIDRLFALREIKEYELAVVLAKPWSAVTGQWYGRAVLIVLAMIVVIFFIAIVMAALGRQVQARIEVERRAGAALAERRRAELEIQSSKLDALARLSGGVAHEFNNLLQPVKTLSELGVSLTASDSEDSRERLRQYFERIQSAATMASAIARDFLTFCGTNSRPMQRGNLGGAVRQATDQVRPLVADLVDLELETAPNVEAQFDELGLAQVILNLVKNAVEASQSAPTRHLHFRIRVSVSRAVGGDAVLQISDNGPGMNETVRARVLEPFFTTKGPSGGTGLGLAVVYGIVTAWGGQLGVESQPDAGATFTITLPAVTEGTVSKETDLEFRTSSA